MLYILQLQLLLQLQQLNKTECELDERSVTFISTSFSLIIQQTYKLNPNKDIEPYIHLK